MKMQNEAYLVEQEAHRSKRRKPDQIILPSNTTETGNKHKAMHRSKEIDGQIKTEYDDLNRKME